MGITLRETTVRTMSNTECCTLGHKYNCSSLTDNMMCSETEMPSHTGSGMKATGSCQGDSGGPVVTYSASKQVYVQTGIVSWAKGCGQKEYPNVHTRVSMAVDWIKDKMTGSNCFEELHVVGNGYTSCN